MLFRVKVLSETVDAQGMTFQATGPVDVPRSDVEQVARDLEAGAVTRFYRGGQPQGRVVAARATTGGLWLKVRLSAREREIWRLVETGAINTVEVQVLPRGVDVFLKSVAATYPTAVY